MAVEAAGAAAVSAQLPARTHMTHMPKEPTKRARDNPQKNGRADMRWAGRALASSLDIQCGHCKWPALGELGACWGAASTCTRAAIAQLS